MILLGVSGKYGSSVVSLDKVLDFFFFISSLQVSKLLLEGMISKVFFDV